MNKYQIKKFPKSRIATNDVCEIGQQKHYITALIEIDVTEGREKIKKYKLKSGFVSFNAWLIKVISLTIRDFESIASFMNGKRKIIIFKDINISIAVEKEMNGQKVPIPLVIEKADEISLESLSQQLEDARNKIMDEGDIVLQRNKNRLESIYYYMPGFVRRMFWKYLLKHPKFAFSKMGNVAFTSVGMIGRINGWFIPKSVHPVCFGIGSVIKKPIVVNDKIEIREMLNMSILLDHDVIDGADMARFIRNLSRNIEKGMSL